MCPKHVELILEINKIFIVHLVGFLYYFTYIDDARSNTNQVSKFKLHLSAVSNVTWVSKAQYFIHPNHRYSSLRPIITLGVKRIKITVFAIAVKLRSLNEICKASVNAIPSCNEKAAGF